MRAAVRSQDLGQSRLTARPQPKSPPPVNGVSLDKAARSSPVSGSLTKLANLKLVAVIFMLFLLVTSDVFLHSAVSGFDGAVEGRGVTSRGTVIQGIFLVLFYIMSLYLIDNEVI